MTEEEVMERVIRIRYEKGDSETAHILEKSLWEDVLVAISDGASKKLAKEALKTREIKFNRYYS